MSTNVFHNAEVRGRKQYRCCLCGYRIRKNAKHISQSGIFDGVFCSSRFHSVCYSTACENWDHNHLVCPFLL